MNKFLSWFEGLRYWVKVTLTGAALISAAIAFPMFVAPLIDGTETKYSKKACNELKEVLNFEAVEYVNKSCYGLNGKQVTVLF